MLFSFAITLLVLAPLICAQNPSFLSGLIQTLRASNLTSLANASTQINSTTVGLGLFSQLATGNNFTIFAPSNAAFQNFSQNVTNDPNLLADILTYHVVTGSFVNYTTIFPNVTIGRTLLTNSSFVTLEGNKSQVLAWTVREDNKTHVLNQPTDVTIQNVTNYNSVQINVIDAVLTIPANLSTTLANITALSNFQLIGDITTVPVANTTSNSTTNLTVIEFLDRAKGFTLFVPDNKAFIDPAFTMSKLITNNTAMLDVIRNQLINGTTIYSPSLLSESLVSSAGENLTFLTNSSGTFVSSNGITALIVQPDVLLSNGVVHVIDKVLINTQTNEVAASSAFMSATSAVASGGTTTESGPVGLPTITAAVLASSAVRDDLSDFSVVLFGFLFGLMFVFF